MKIVSGECREGSYVQLSIAGGEGLGLPRIITRQVHCSQDAGLYVIVNNTGFRLADLERAPLPGARIIEETPALRRYPAATLEFEVSECNISIPELTEYVQAKYGSQWKFNRTEPRYASCVIAIYEEVE